MDVFAFKFFPTIKTINCFATFNTTKNLVTALTAYQMSTISAQYFFMFLLNLLLSKIEIKIFFDRVYLIRNLFNGIKANRTIGFIVIIIFKFLLI